MKEIRERETYTMIIDGSEVTVIRKAINFTKAAVKHVRKGRPKATEAQVAERFAICEKCDYLNPDEMTCKKCGCGIKSVVGPFSKLAWADSHCPDGRWIAI
jgi:hypothetical protein